MHYSEVLQISGPIEASTTGKIVEFLMNNQLKDVCIFLNTPGGCVQQAREICHNIKLHGRVTVHAFADCSSAGTLILCSAARKLCSPTCTMTVHYGEEVAYSLEDSRWNKRIRKWMRDIYKQSTKVSARTVTTWMNKETTFDAERALKVGLVDEIQGLLL